MDVLGVYRESVYSPGRARDDTLILEETARELARRGARVYLRHAHEIDQGATPPGLVFTMAQGEEGLGALHGWSEQGTPIVNTATAVRNCRRARTLALCAAAGVPMPQSWLVHTFPSPLWGRMKEGVLAPIMTPLPGLPLQGGKEQILVRMPCQEDFSRSLWVKRADVHATQPGDVVRVWHEAEMVSVLNDFARRGILHAVIQTHCPGKVVKFYGVGPGRFFDYPGLNPVMRAQVASLATVAARAVGLEIFGGDCVLTSEGTPVLIDLNDWPSFARCRTAAAQAIADHLSQRAQSVI
jgi:hypothetical protein